MAQTKFSTEPRLLILSVAALVMLSAALVTQTPRQCYWCGPLADQVHRSARALPCNGVYQITTCDPGLDFCAVVGTAPPYIESRYCVKNYQDECYPLYCNTTSAWKMICPCKENLCNGPNTEREKEAFATLMTLVESNRTKRMAKRNGPGFIKSNTQKTKIITNVSGIQENMLNGTFEEKQELLTEIIVSSESAMETVGDIEDNVDNIESTTATDIEEAVTGETEDTTIDDIKLTEVESIKDEIIPVVTTNSPVTITDVPQMSTNIQKPIVVNQDEAPKSSEVLPTAEALQQNASPSPVISEKATESTTTTAETTTVLTTVKLDPLTNQTEKKNGDIKISSSIFVIATAIFVQILAL